MFMNDLAAVRNNRPASAEMMNLPRDDGDDYRGSVGLSEQERRRRATAARAQAQAQAHAQLQALQRQQQGQSVAAAAAASRGGAVAVPLNPRAREPSDGTTAAAVHGLLNLTPSARRGTGLSEADPSLAAAAAAGVGGAGLPPPPLAGAGGGGVSAEERRHHLRQRERRVAADMSSSEADAVAQAAAEASRRHPFGALAAQKEREDRRRLMAREWEERESLRRRQRQQQQDAVAAQRLQRLEEEEQQMQQLQERQQQMARNKERLELLLRREEQERQQQRLAISGEDQLRLTRAQLVQERLRQQEMQQQEELLIRQQRERQLEQRRQLDLRRQQRLEAAGAGAGVISQPQQRLGGDEEPLARLRREEEELRVMTATLRQRRAQQIARVAAITGLTSDSEGELSQGTDASSRNLRMGREELLAIRRRAEFQAASSAAAAGTKPVPSSAAEAAKWARAQILRGSGAGDATAVPSQARQGSSDDNTMAQSQATPSPMTGPTDATGTPLHRPKLPPASSSSGLGNVSAMLLGGKTKATQQYPTSPSSTKRLQPDDFLLGGALAKKIKTGEVANTGLFTEANLKALQLETLARPTQWEKQFPASQQQEQQQEHDLVRQKQQDAAAPFASPKRQRVAFRLDSQGRTRDEERAVPLQREGGSSSAPTSLSMRFQPIAPRGGLEPEPEGESEHGTKGGDLSSFMKLAKNGGGGSKADLAKATKTFEMAKTQAVGNAQKKKNQDPLVAEHDTRAALSKSSFPLPRLVSSSGRQEGDQEEPSYRPIHPGALSSFRIRWDALRRSLDDRQRPLTSVHCLRSVPQDSGGGTGGSAGEADAKPRQEEEGSWSCPTVKKLPPPMTREEYIEELTDKFARSLECPVGVGGRDDPRAGGVSIVEDTSVTGQYRKRLGLGMKGSSAGTGNERASPPALPVPLDKSEHGDADNVAKKESQAKEQQDTAAAAAAATGGGALASPPPDMDAGRGASIPQEGLKSSSAPPSMPLLQRSPKGTWRDAATGRAIDLSLSDDGTRGAERSSSLDGGRPRSPSESKLEVQHEPDPSASESKEDLVTTTVTLPSPEQKQSWPRPA